MNKSNYVSEQLRSSLKMGVISIPFFFSNGKLDINPETLSPRH